MKDITMRRSIAWNSFSDTNVGCVRSINEDSILDYPEIGLWVVADGMGGYEAGDVASNMIVESLSEIDNNESLSDFVDTVEDKLIHVNKQIQEYADVMCERQIMGSTVVCLVIRGRLGVCLWAGDSRLYRYRNCELEQLSQDHSQIEELIQQGFLKKEEAKNHPDANVITRAVGACEDIYISINVFSTQIGDTYLLCSDGLHNMVTDEYMSNCLNEKNIKDSTEKMMELALKNNAPDNVSIITVRGKPEKINKNKVSLDRQ